MFDLRILEVINKLQDAGFEAYLVGGIVRDSILGRKSNDYDITTNALPNQIKEVYKDYQIYTYGEKFGTIAMNLYLDDTVYVLEFTTYRKDVEYLNHRHPNFIQFESSLREDLSRRDFTINALAYDCKTNKIIDLHNGKEDLKNHIIRTIGNPNKRFSEDGLRILRALRFACSLGFDIEEETKTSILENYTLLRFISKERITEEISKMLLNGIDRVFYQYIDLFKFLVPGLNKVNDNFKCFKSEDLAYMYAMLFSMCDNYDEAISSFRLTKEVVRKIKYILDNEDVVLTNDDKDVRKKMFIIGEIAYKNINEYRKLIGKEYTDDIIIKRCIEEGVLLKDLNIKGSNIKKILDVDGKVIKDILNEVFFLVVDEKIDNNYEAIKEYLVKKYKK